jgi:hypothetical protein
MSKGGVASARAGTPVDFEKVISQKPSLPVACSKTSRGNKLRNCFSKIIFMKDGFLGIFRLRVG